MAIELEVCAYRGRGSWGVAPGVRCSLRRHGTGVAIELEVCAYRGRGSWGVAPDGARRSLRGCTAGVAIELHRGEGWLLEGRGY